MCMTSGFTIYIYTRMHMQNAYLHVDMHMHMRIHIHIRLHKRLHIRTHIHRYTYIIFCFFYTCLLCKHLHNPSKSNIMESAPGRASALRLAGRVPHEVGQLVIQIRERCFTSEPNACILSFLYDNCVFFWGASRFQSVHVLHSLAWDSISCIS